MEKIYFSLKGFWKGKSTVKKIAKDAKLVKVKHWDFLEYIQFDRFSFLH